MIPAGVKYFWEDIVCRYWKWARKAGGREGSDMKPCFPVHNAWVKAHNWTCQLIKSGLLKINSIKLNLQFNTSRYRND